MFALVCERLLNDWNESRDNNVLSTTEWRIYNDYVMAMANTTKRFCHSNARIFFFREKFKIFIAVVAHSQLSLLNRSSRSFLLHSLYSFTAGFFVEISILAKNSKNEWWTNKWTNRSFCVTFVWWKQGVSELKILNLMVPPQLFKFQRDFFILHLQQFTLFVRTSSQLIHMQQQTPGFPTITCIWPYLTSITCNIFILHVIEVIC